MPFDSRKSITRTADAESFTANIVEGTNVVRADISYKPSFKIGPPSITTRDMDSLMAALVKQDPTTKFYKRGADAGTLSTKDAATLDALKNDPHTSDAVYRTACASFGVKPQPRSVTAAPVASTANLPQGVPALRASAEAWVAFETAHAELFTGVFAQQNLDAIENWFADERVQWTADTLAQCYRELKSANCFRTAATLTRGMNGALQIVQPYSHERILQLRNQQVTAKRTAAPVGMSEADTAAWNTIVQNYPGVPVGSPKFRELCGKQVLAWAKESVLENQPELAAADKRGQLSVAISKLIALWTRNPNLGQGQKTIKDTRIWLG